MLFDVASDEFYVQEDFVTFDTDNCCQRTFGCGVVKFRCTRHPNLFPLRTLWLFTVDL